MENNLEKCSCCGGVMYYEKLDKFIEGAYNKQCAICMSSICNLEIIKGSIQLTKPYFSQGSGGLYLPTDRGIGISILKEDYSNLDDLIKIGEEYIADGHATLKECYIYKFNPDTNTGEFVWGAYNPFKEGQTTLKEGKIHFNL